MDEHEYQKIILGLQQALNTALIGGNHIASNLIGLIDDPCKYNTTEEAMHDLSTKPERTVTWMNEYEQWCCWKQMMKARDKAVETLKGYNGERLGSFIFDPIPESEPKERKP